MAPASRALLAAPQDFPGRRCGEIPGTSPSMGSGSRDAFPSPARRGPAVNTTSPFSRQSSASVSFCSWDPSAAAKSPEEPVLCQPPPHPVSIWKLLWRASTALTLHVLPSHWAGPSPICSPGQAGLTGGCCRAPHWWAERLRPRASAEGLASRPGCLGRCTAGERPPWVSLLWSPPACLRYSLPPSWASHPAGAPFE